MDSDEPLHVLSNLFKDMHPADRAILCSVSGDPSNAPVHAWGGVPWGLGERYRLLSSRNNYVAISSFRRVEDRWRRRKDQFVALHAVMIDDVGTKIPKSAILGKEFSPTLVVETSPDNYQVTYFLDTPQRDQEVAEGAILQMIATLTGGGVDPGMAGVTRVIRLPGGINGKPKYQQDGEPFRVRITKYFPDQRISWLNLQHAFGFVEKMHSALFVEPTDAVTLGRKRSFALVLTALNDLKIIKRRGRGWFDLRCPWTSEHTDRADTGAAIAVPARANGYMGGYRCHHGHCAGRTWGDLEDWVFDEVIAEGSRTAQPFGGRQT